MLEVGYVGLFSLRLFKTIPKLTALLHGTEALVSATVCGVVEGMQLRNFRRGHHLYSTGQPSRWASID